MRTNHPTHVIVSTGRRFTRACAAVLAVVLTAAPCAHAATDTANASVLRANLPPNLTLKQASIAQMVKALHEAVVQHHDDAVDLLRIAVLAKTPKQGDGLLSCEDLIRLVRAATTAATDKTSQLIDMGASLHPECADSLQNLLAGADALGEDAGNGFGIGFGPGFPGSPGFVGSAPSGAFALPPVTNPVTAVTNK